MSLLNELKTLLTAEPLGLPFETGHWDSRPPDVYLVAVPLTDELDLYGDNKPELDVQEVQLSLYIRGSYTEKVRQLVRAILEAGYTITARRFVGYDQDTRYHHYAIDVAQYYEFEEE